jgi:hypothetical protein
MVIVTDPAFQGSTAGPADPTLRAIFNESVAGTFDRTAAVSGGRFLGEGGGLRIPTIGFIPQPQYLCAVAPDGEISKLNSKLLHDQVALTVKCLLAMQQDTADQLSL